MQDQKTASAPASLSGMSADACLESCWFSERLLVKGGPAGKGDVLPEPPQMVIDGSKEYPSMMEELDTGETEGKTKMAFAKMQIPNELRDKYVLQDKDFELNESQNDKESPNGVSVEAMEKEDALAEASFATASVGGATVQTEGYSDDFDNGNKDVASANNSVSNSRRSPGTLPASRPFSKEGERTPSASKGTSPRGTTGKNIKPSNSNASLNSTGSLPSIGRKSKVRENVEAAGLYA